MWTLRRKAILTHVLAFVVGILTSEQLRPEPEAIVVTEQVLVEGKREVVTVERVVTRTIKPDGTVVEKTRDKAKVAKTESKKAERKEVKVTQPAKAKYSLGVQYLPSLTEPPSARDLEVTAGARLGNTNAWATAGYDVKHNQVSIGLRYEW